MEVCRQDGIVAPTEAMKRRISAGQDAQRRIRRSVSGSLTLLSLALSVLCLGFFIMDDRWLRGDSPCAVGRHVQFFFIGFGRSVPLATWNLVPLANDLKATRWVLLADSLWSMNDGNIEANRIVGEIHERYGLTLPGEFKSCLLFSIWSVATLRVLGFLSLLCCAIRMEGSQDVIELQRRMWKLIAVSYALDTCWCFCIICFMTFDCPVVSGWWVVFWHIVVVALALQPQWRDVVHAKMASIYSQHYSYHAAASIAGLVGDCSAEEVTRQASERFRGIHLTDLTFGDMADNVPNPALFERTRRIHLHRCDAFISHSWHDDAQEKWDALQRWRSTFVEEHSREPVLWIDKCCIDQEDITANLRCLPIFLMGCRKLVVFLGATYLTRLWCIMELFTCAHMGNVDRIECIPLGSPVTKRDSKREVRKFDAKACECFKPDEKLKMLQIICAAYGDLRNFNAAVKEILHATTVDLESDSESSSDSETDAAPALGGSSAQLSREDSATTLASADTK